MEASAPNLGNRRQAGTAGTLLLGPMHTGARLQVQGAGTLELWGTGAMDSIPLLRVLYTPPPRALSSSEPLPTAGR